MIKLDYNKLEPHPLGAIFPPMSDSTYAEFVKGMKKNGYDPKEKIVLLDGQILDGNHRYTAAKKLKLKLGSELFEEFKGEDPFSFVVQHNLHRRHLTPSQAAAAAADLALAIKAADKAERDAQKAQVKAEKAASKGNGAKGTAKPKEKAKRVKKGSTAGRAAKALNVSERAVNAALELKKNNPEGFEAVKSGEQTVHAAAKDSAEKKSAKDRKTDAFNAACANIDAILGPDYTERVKLKVKTKDLIQMSGLVPEEMKRVAPYIEMGWAYKMALGYQAVSLTAAHQIRIGFDRAFAQGGRHIMDIAIYGKKGVAEFTFPEMLNPS